MQEKDDAYIALSDQVMNLMEERVSFKEDILLEQEIKEAVDRS
jgi:hypothetical protein